MRHFKRSVAQVAALQLEDGRSLFFSAGGGDLVGFVFSHDGYLSCFALARGERHCVGLSMRVWRHEDHMGTIPIIPWEIFLRPGNDAAFEHVDLAEAHAASSFAAVREAEPMLSMRITGRAIEAIEVVLDLVRGGGSPPR